MVLQSALGIVFGPEYRPMRVPFDDSAIVVGGVPLLSPYDLFVLVVAVVVMARAGRPVPVDVARPADARRRVRPRGVPPARRPGVAHGHRRLGAVQRRRVARGAAAGADEPRPEPARHRLAVRARLHRRGGRRARLARRRAGRRGGRRRRDEPGDRLPRRRPGADRACSSCWCWCSSCDPRDCSRRRRRGAHDRPAAASRAAPAPAHAPASRRAGPSSPWAARSRSTRSATTSSPSSPRTCARRPGSPCSSAPPGSSRSGTPRSWRSAGTGSP